MGKRRKKSNKQRGYVNSKPNYDKISRFEEKANKKREKDKERVFIRKRVRTPFPTNYLPTIQLKLSSIIRYYQMKAEIRRADRQQRKERDIEISKYSVLIKYLEEEIEKARAEFIKSKGETSGILLFKINYRFDSVLSKTINYLNIQDDVELVAMNENYEKLAKTPPSRLLVVKLHEYLEVNNIEKNI